MGSSKTGSLDKFAKFSPAAAFGSGKVKLPETGLIGMMQQNQEDKMAFNAANIAAQQQAGQQKAQYNQMLQQMRSRMAPTPFANGGNVTLRRKMFKLGGSASAHGTGLTSGLEFNQGGAVVKPGPDGQPRQHAVAGGVIAAAKALAAAARARKAKPLLDFIRRPKTEIGALTGRGPAFTPASRFQKLLRTSQLAGVAGTPLAGASLLADTFGFDRLTDEERKTATDLEKGFDTARGVVEFLPSLTGPGAIAEGVGLGIDTLVEAAKEDPDYFQAVTIPDLIRKAAGTLPEREKTLLELDDETKDIGMTPDELSELANQQQRDNLEEAMAMYQDLIRGEDNTNKLMTLGDAAIAAGSALMEGEGYGGAATAFNEPLAQARAQQQALDTESRAAAAQLAIGEDITSRQLQEAQRAELLATGMFDTEEEINSILLGRQFGIARTIPEDDKGEIDEDAVIQAGAGVYVDPKQRFGVLFIAMNSDNKPLRTNDPEQAKQHAKS